MCPACGFLTTPASASSCPCCGADPRLPLWRQTRPAWLGVRFFAAGFDHGAFAGLSAFLSSLFPSFAGHPLFLGALYFAFFALPTALFATTLGKALFGLRVLDATTGQRPSCKQALIREIPGRLLTFFLLSPLGYATVLRKHSRAQTFHDLLASTVVCRSAPRPSRPS